MSEKIIKYLLPYKLKYISYISLLIGFVLYFVRFTLGIKLSLFDCNVFAIYSDFFEKKSFTFIQNNLSEEIIAFLFILGINLLAITQEKTEYVSYYKIRVDSLILAFIINSIFLIISLFTIFGLAFIWVMSISLISLPLIYVIIFKIKIYYFLRTQKK
jgi:hypothetical protein